MMTQQEHGYVVVVVVALIVLAVNTVLYYFAKTKWIPSIGKQDDDEKNPNGGEK